MPHGAELQAIDLQWWNKEGAQATESLFSAFRRVEQQDLPRLEDIKRFTRIYENRDYAGLAPGTYTTRRGAHGHSGLNITKSVVDTVTAKVAKTRPHTRFQTIAGNRSLRRKAQLLERWVEAEQYRGGIDALGPDVFLDCCITGTGIFKHVKEDKRVCSERVWPGDLFVDATDGFEGKPHQMFQRTWVDRQQLIKRFRSHAEELGRAMPSTPYNNHGRDPLADQLELVEAWYVVDGKGRHIMAVEGVEPLVHKPWNRDHPFTFIRWSHPRRGFWGIGLVEELMPQHISINRTLAQIEKNLKFGNFQFWLDVASRIKGQKLTNEPGDINYYRNTPPQGFAIEPLAPSLLVHLDSQVARAYATAGVSMDSAAGQNTLGADASGIARREFNELETERFAIVATEWQTMWMETAKQYVHIGKELGSDPNYTVIAANDRNTIREVKWSEVDMEYDSYVIRVAPVSALPSLPSAKLAHVKDLMDMTIISPEQAGKLLSWPDLEEFLALDRAMSDYLDKVIELMLDDGEAQVPTPFQDHQLALKKCQASLLKAMDDGVPEKNLRLLRNFMSQTHKMMERAMLAQQGALMPGAPGTPPGPGMTGQAPMAVRPQDGTVPS